jgi:23S rRNA (adenine2503-C2)-methyltransferase
MGNVMPAPGSLTFAAPRRAKPPRHLADLTAAARREAVTALGEPAFRAAQLSKHYFGRFTDDPADWTDIPAGRRADLARELLPPLLTPVSEVSCDAGLTRKTAWRLFDGALVESVLMRYPDRTTVCVSSQAGCGMNCPFCATGQAGLTRNMSAGEIVAQVVAACRTARAEGTGKVSNVVFMGMGEPLANYAALETALRRLTDPVPDGLGLSRRGVVVSTVGLVPAIGRLADSGLGVTLALSLHAPDDELRDTLVPVNTRWKVAEAVAAAHGYFARTGRRVSIEYALIRDVNDQAWRADALADVLLAHASDSSERGTSERDKRAEGRGTGWVHVNLIPLNPTPGSAWTASRDRDEKVFVRRLEARGVAVTVRDTRGREIDGACGQLAAAAVRETP